MVGVVVLDREGVADSALVVAERLEAFGLRCWLGR